MGIPALRVEDVGCSSGVSADCFCKTELTGPLNFGAQGLREAALPECPLQAPGNPQLAQLTQR